MNKTVGLRTALAVLVLLAFVVAATGVIIAPALLGGPQAATVRPLDPAVAISHP